MVKVDWTGNVSHLKILAFLLFWSFCGELSGCSYFSGSWFGLRGIKLTIDNEEDSGSIAQEQPERKKFSSIFLRRLFWTLPLFSSYNSGLRHCSSDNGQVSCALHRSAALGTDPHFYQNILRDNKDVLMCRNAEEIVEQKNCFTFWLLYKWSPKWWTG